MNIVKDAFVQSNRANIRVEIKATADAKDDRASGQISSFGDDAWPSNGPQ